MKVDIQSFNMNDQKEVDKMKIFIEKIGKDNLISVTACANSKGHTAHVIFWIIGT